MRDEEGMSASLKDLKVLEHVVPPQLGLADTGSEGTSRRGVGSASYFAAQAAKERWRRQRMPGEGLSAAEMMARHRQMVEGMAEQVTSKPI